MYGLIILRLGEPHRLLIEQRARVPQLVARHRIDQGGLDPLPAQPTAGQITLESLWRYTHDFASLDARRVAVAAVISACSLATKARKLAGLTRLLLIMSGSMLGITEHM